MIPLSAPQTRALHVLTRSHGAFILAALGDPGEPGPVAALLDPLQVVIAENGVCSIANPEVIA